MKVLRGKMVSPGYARGKAFIASCTYGVCPRPAVPRFKISAAEVAGQLARFEYALAQSVHELETLGERLRSEIGEAESGIFEAHLGLLRDPEFVRKVKERVHRDLVNADQAVELELRELENLLGAIQNEYLRERAQDIRDVGRRVLKHLLVPNGHQYPTLSRLPPDSVVVADELLPSDTLELDREHVVALLTARGGQTCHAAILARSMGLPYISGLENLTSYISDGDVLLVDATAESVTVSPTIQDAAVFCDAKAQYDEQLQIAAAVEARECVTTDGVAIQLHANLGRVAEAESVKQHHLAGVGLFRTEYLFLEEPEPPSVDKQRRAYTAMARALHPLPVTIRTLDLAPDKKPGFLKHRHPSAGYRGLRFSLAEQELLQVQLRAIVSAAQKANVRVLFPMVLGVSDLQMAVDALRSVAEQENVSELPLVGAMIETPSALFEIEDILEIADFVSIGTNDLTQFMLAADRETAGLLNESSVLHPAVLRAIAKVVDAARLRERAVCICGEAAGDPLIAALFVGLGVRQLSMSPFRAARVRYLLRQTSSRLLEAKAREALCAKADWAVKNILEDLQEQAA